jgi:hypothetical protein
MFVTSISVNSSVCCSRKDVMAVHPLRSQRLLAFLACCLSFAGLALAVQTQAAQAEVHWTHFCWGKTLTGKDNHTTTDSCWQPFFGIIEAEAWSPQHSVCLEFQIGNERKCSSGPGVHVFLRKASVCVECADYVAINNNAEGSSTVYGNVQWDDGGGSGGGGGGGTSEGGGESPPPSPEKFIGFQSNGHTMWDYSSSIGPFNTGSGEAPGTSPSVAYVSGVGYLMAFQGSDGNLWIYNRNADSWLNTNLGMTAGTSPSIAASSDGTYRVAFEASNGVLWYYSSAAKAGFSTGGGMTPGTSPSLTWGPNIGYIAAFQAADHNLWTYGLGNGVFSNSNLGMTTATSPSIVANTANSYVIGIQASDHNLWTYTSGHIATNRNMGMLMGTSPSLASQEDYSGNGDWIAAFQANSGAMWYYSSSSSAGINTGSGMAPGTSPSADYLPGEGYALSFQANNTTLWTFQTGIGSWYNTGLGMAANTSPSLVIH